MNIIMSNKLHLLALIIPTMFESVVQEIIHRPDWSQQSDLTCIDASFHIPCTI